MNRNELIGAAILNRHSLPVDDVKATKSQVWNNTISDAKDFPNKISTKATILRDYYRVCVWSITDLSTYVIQ